MNIRALKEEDVDKIREIHSRFYKHEFEFPDFLNNFLCSFIVSDDKEGIITAGGVRLIAEVIAITDKGKSVRKRRSGLYQVLDASMFITKKADFNELHAFIQDEKWYNHLKSIGFLPSKGKSLVLELR